MAIGDVFDVEGHPDLSYVDTGMYDTSEYGCVYLLDADRPAVVDTGIGTNHELVLDALDEVGIARNALEVIAVTHVHLDHAGGAGFLAADCPNTTVYVHEVGAPHLMDPERVWEGTKRAVGEQIRYYTKPDPVPGDRIEELGDGDKIHLGDRTLDVHRAPGHAPHQVVFDDPNDSVLFAADAAGIYVPQLDAVRETTPPPTFDLEQCLDDVDLCRRLDPETLCYTHFGPAPTDARLDEYEAVLTEWVETVADAWERHGDNADAVDELVSQTEMADIWGAQKAAAETAMNARGVLQYLDEREW